MSGCDGTHGGPERWATLERFPAYEVSSHGRVRRRDSQRVLTGGITDRGYRKYNFGIGSGKQPYGHRLVAEAFHGWRPTTHEADHEDFVRTHNCVMNVRWMLGGLNKVRWSGRIGTRNFWMTPDDVPEGYEFTEDEAEVVAELQAAGW